MIYEDRQSAGEILAERVSGQVQEKPLLLAIPRGGVIVAQPIAQKYAVAIHPLIVRKIGHPANPEVAVGAVMPDGRVLLDEALIARSAVTPDYLQRAGEEAYAEILWRQKEYTGTRALPAIRGATAVVVDDGIATGYTLRAAISWLLALRPAKVVLAVPVAPPDVIPYFEEQGTVVICPLQPHDFQAVGQYYRHFPQNTDAEVIQTIAAVNK